MAAARSPGGAPADCADADDDDARAPATAAGTATGAGAARGRMRPTARTAPVEIARSIGACGRGGAVV